MLKSLARKLIPAFLLELYRKSRRYKEHQLNRSRSNEAIFTDIYEKSKWGGSKGDFYSGTGSSDSQIVTAYVSMVSEKASTEGFRGMNFVDLGCGDFSVSRHLLPFCSNYVGVDIVPQLIRRNQNQWSTETIHFAHLDIVHDSLPAGDVCFIRQVLQHLSNQQIGHILRKLKAYKWVFITEHYPTDNDAIVPNIDKIPGADIRGCDNSGVYLSKSPFNLPERTLSVVLEVPGTGCGRGHDQGVIRTFLYKPGAEEDEV